MASGGEHIIVNPENNSAVQARVAEMIATSQFITRLIIAEKTDADAPIKLLDFSIHDIHVADPDGMTHPRTGSQEPKRLFITGRVVNEDGSESHRVVNFSPDPFRPDQPTEITVSPSMAEEEEPEPFNGPRIHC